VIVSATQDQPPLRQALDCTDAGCHDEYGDRGFVHGPALVGSCDACHKMVDEKDHTVELVREGAAMCTFCHLEGTSGKVVHDPVAEGECLTCHDPHAGNDTYYLMASSVAELCGDCHDDILEQAGGAAVGHDAVTTGSACANCHNPHASDLDHILRRDEMGLCLSCHNKVIETGSGPIADMNKLFKESPSVHGPIEDGECSICHQAHGGSRFRLLTEDYPSEFYVSYEQQKYALCFQCHEADAFESERTADDTNFRNGDRNLHYVHVNRKEKGATCRACHEVHAGKQPHHIAGSVQAGDSKMAISFQKTSTGGACQTTCHKLHRYDRD